jgi:hypothetical protein
MKNTKLITAAIFIMLVFAATYTINAYTNLNVQAAAEVYTCPMHPDVVQDNPGSCPKCGMDLVLKSDDNQNTDLLKCENMDKCKEMGCEMGSCKGNAGACNENCSVKKEHKDMDKSEHREQKKMNHKKCMGH